MEAVIRLHSQTYSNLEKNCLLNPSHAMPAESQWDLLDEYRLNNRFDVAWIDTEKIDEAAERFRVDPGSGVLCDLDTAFDLIDNDEQETLAWIGTHSPGWSVSVTMNRGFTLSEEASAEGKSILTHGTWPTCTGLPTRGCSTTTTERIWAG
ncbi:hypothetical protein ACIBKY_50740 [Nonomuraea sp. NPDC050394]|uniref:hypothetical protein n=1 Tax=Nonomuraea sp. NPDC050394 TaxID=3364363 RepID=UPI00378EB092